MKIKKLPMRFTPILITFFPLMNNSLKTIQIDIDIKSFDETRESFLEGYSIDNFDLPLFIKVIEISFKKL